MVKVQKEVVEKVINLDCREEDGIRRLKKSLIKLPMIKSFKDLTTDRLEEIMNEIEFKYDIQLGYFFRYRLDEKHMYSCMLKNSEGKWLITIHALSLWEGLAKAIFYSYYYISSKKHNKKGSKT